MHPTASSPTFGGNNAALPASEYNAGRLTGPLANAGGKYLDAGNRLTERTSNSGHVKRRLARALSLVLDQDYRTTHLVSIGKRTLKIAEPPIGALILLLYPFTIGPRLHRALQRDPSKTEAGDVLRRDMTAITIFLFLLKPLVNGLNTLKQRFDGLKLVEQSHSKDFIGKVFTYSHFKKHYRIDNAQQLAAIVTDGNAKGLQDAIKRSRKQYGSVLPKIEGGKPVLDLMGEFDDKVKALIKQFNAGNQAEFNKLAQEAYAVLDTAETRYNAIAGKVAPKQGLAKLAKMIKPTSRIPALKDMVGYHAQMKRLPVDVLGFATVVLAIGWFPVWFNNLLSSKKREGGGDAPKQGADSFDPRQAYQALRQTSRLTPSFPSNTTGFSTPQA